ncbi:unnamed protein product [Rotaria sordida]|uniref:HTH CENPB-type domain-containing protein n=3 Tax=Rotaria sordida TaxID=392033 RepID=A0A814SQB7_9BILA|nr:unnamed protein product [Rotaria sordida]
MQLARFREYVQNDGNRRQKLSRLEQFVLEKFKRARDTNLPVHDPDIRRWSLTQAAIEGIDNFVASDKWLSNFKRRNHIRSRKITSITLFVFGNDKQSTMTPLINRHSQSIINDFICPLQGDKWIIVTTIFYPTKAIYKFLNLTTQWNLIVIGDQKTPKDWLTHLSINSSRFIYLSIEQQNTLPFRILHYLPYGSYARKNLGYLIAIKCGAKIIFESDDDNLLETNDIYFLPKIVQQKHVPWIGFHRQRSPFINIYGSFGHPNIWPRGFPIDEIRNVTEDGWHSVRKNLEYNTYAYIQQYLADLDPDVDAIVSYFLFFVCLYNLINQTNFD